MKRAIVLSCLILITAVPAFAAEGDGWISLFNGKDLSGWKVNEENPGTFRVEDGKIVVNGNRSHLFYAGPVCNADFKDFIFEAEVMTQPKANSGIYFHTRYQPSGWPAYGYESQVNQTHPDPQKSGGLYDAAKVNPSPAKDGQWYKHRIEVRDNHVQVWINGKQVVDYVEPEDVSFPGWPNRKLSHGTFALQGHDPESVVHFRNIRVKPIQCWDEAWVRLDNGKDLSGWTVSEENPGTFSVKDGAIVAKGDRAHLFYTGPVYNANFRNFEYMVDVMTKPGSNGGLYFHTEYQKSGWPSKGFEVQVNNSYERDPRKTGSLYAVEDLTVPPAKDNVWFTEHIIVRNDNVIVKVDGVEVVNWVQPADWEGRDRSLSSGTFGLQGHDPGSEVHYKNIRVRPLDPDPAKRGQWVPLFDGETLQGWQLLNGWADYKVQDGAIVGTTAKGSPNSFLCTKTYYSDFELEFEVKVDSSLNSGVQVRSNSYKNYRDYRVHGYQVEIATNGTAGYIYDEARRGWLSEDRSDSAARAAFQDGEWNKYRVVCLGESLRTWVNGVPVADVQDDMTDCGFIGLQVHSYGGEKPAQVRWRNLRIRDLSGAEKKTKVAFVTGGHAYDEKEFAEFWQGFDDMVVVREHQNDGSELFEKIGSWPYDVIVLYNMSQKITPERQENFKTLLGRGVGLVAMHHNMAAWQDWSEYRDLIGAKYYTKPADGHAVGTYKHDVDMPVQVAADHAVTKGLKDFTIHDESYKGCWWSPENTVLLKTTAPTSDAVVAWIPKSDARIVGIQLGHDAKAYANPAFGKLVSQAVRWADGKN